METVANFWRTQSLALTGRLRGYFARAQAGSEQLVLLAGAAGEITGLGLKDCREAADLKDWRVTEWRNFVGGEILGQV